MKMKLIVILLAAVVLTGCASLSEAGKQVEVVNESPKGCTELGELTSGTIASKPSTADVLNDLRNQAAEMGGTVLVKDSIGATGIGGYSGSGRAFKCVAAQ